MKNLIQEQTTACEEIQREYWQINISDQVYQQCGRRNLKNDTLWFWLQ